MNENDFAPHAQEWIDAWNGHDLEQILSHYADDVEFISPFVGKLMGNPEDTVRGISALREYFARGLAAYPSLQFELIGVYPGARSCVVEYISVNNLRAAEVMEFDSDGKVRRVLAHYRPNENLNGSNK